MANITAALVKELRERTGAGMMDCKKALVECDGDMDKAIDFLREKGLAAAAKKAGRIAAEGMVDTFVDENGVGVTVEVNCETDFVANTDRFKDLCRDFAKHIAAAAPATVEEMLAQPFYKDASKTVNDLIGEATASIGEKISVRRFARFVPEHGMVDSFVDENGVGVTVEVNCETDFVANTDRFKDLCRDFAKHIAAAAPATVEEMLAQPFYADASKTVNDLIGEATASIGEKISVRRFARFVAEHGMVDTYNHMGGRIGVMVELSCPEVNDEVKALSHDLVMHIAAANPQFVRRDEVPTDNLEKEREVLTQQALNEGKPAKIVERMVEGRIEKYYKEVCLLEQPFVKDPDINVTKMLGGKADVVRFVRFERGEGLEKRQDNLAADIAAEQAKMKK